LKTSKKAAIASECDRTIDIYVKAAEIFHEQGFDATSMSNIAAAAAALATRLRTAVG
jgi:AcrR family transcriptional regulator